MTVLVWAFSAAGLAQQAATPDAAPAPAPQAPANPPSQFAQAHKLMQQGKIDEAIAELQMFEAHDPATKGLALELGAAYYKKNDFVKVIEYLKQATAANPDNGEAIQLLGLADYRGGHPADAIPLLEKCRGGIRGPTRMLPTSVLGVCYIQTKNYTQARKAFGKMFDVPPDSAASYLFTAQMLLRQGA